MQMHVSVFVWTRFVFNLHRISTRLAPVILNCSLSLQRFYKVNFPSIFVIEAQN